MHSSIDRLRADLLRAQQAAHAGDLPTVLRELDQAVTLLDANQLLTTTEAAHLLGIRSPNTVLAWCRTGYIRGVKRGARTMIPLAEVERVKESDAVRVTKMTDQLHDRAEELGGGDALSEDELEQIHAARPGTLPWERAHEATG